MNALLLALLLGTAPQKPARVFNIRLHGVFALDGLASGCKRTVAPVNGIGGTVQCDDATAWRALTLQSGDAKNPRRCDLRVRWGTANNKWDVEVKPRMLAWTAKFTWVDANTIDVTRGY
jgi:hypothetical protein